MDNYESPTIEQAGGPAATSDPQQLIVNVVAIVNAAVYATALLWSQVAFWNTGTA